MRIRRQRPDRFSRHRPPPSSTTDLVPDDWRIIRLALQTVVVDATRNDQWPKAEAAQRVLNKVADR